VAISFIARNLPLIVAHYIRKHRPRAQAELASFAAERSLEAAVRRAGRAELSGQRRDPHHRRRRQEDLDAAVGCLVGGLASLEQCQNFEAVHDQVKALTRRVQNLGPLYEYDTALRIAAKLGCRPRKVFLHAGARQGARVLGLADGKSFWPGDIPDALAPLRELEPYEIEDVLCIYKAKFEAAVLELSEETGETCRLPEEDDAEA